MPYVPANLLFHDTIRMAKVTVVQSAITRQGILERCLKRLEWDKVQMREAKAAADAKEAERLAMQSIDWCASVCWQ